MKRLMWVLAVVSLMFLIGGCESKGAEGGAEKPKAEAPKAEAPADDKGMALTAEGKKFEPPIKAEALPEGAWYCDMGTVHYARSEKGDGACPLCKMKLKQKATAKK